MFKESAVVCYPGISMDQVNLKTISQDSQSTDLEDYFLNKKQTIYRNAHWL
jgi:hypothetical protein